MNELFTLPVVHQGMEQEFMARFERWGYTHRISVLINGITFTFEPDEEGNYRALSDSAVTANIADVDLLRAVAEKLTQLNEK